MRSLCAKFLGAEQKLIQKCTAATTVCVQQKPGSAACLAKARSTCAKAVAKIGAPGSWLEAKLTAAVVKKCGTIASDDLTGFRGLAWSERTGPCTAIGAAPTSTADVATCALRHHECRVERFVETQTPRLHELLGLGAATLP